MTNTSQSNAQLNTARTSDPQLYILPQPAVGRAHPAIMERLQTCFDAKNRHSPDGFLACFSTDMEAYCDATLGWKVPGWQPLFELLRQYMPNWGRGVSYPTRIMGGPDSALVAVTDTPELFGGEIHALACVDFRDGQIVRWVDYWDSHSFEPAVLEQMTASVQIYPNDLGESSVPSRADAAIVAACHQVHNALTTNTSDLSEIFTYDVVLEDMAARIQLVGQTDVVSFLKRAKDELPFGPGATLLHVVGGEMGGAYEWSGSPHSDVPRGVTALELDEQGRISRLTSVYDSRRFGQERRERIWQRIFG